MSRKTRFTNTGELIEDVWNRLVSLKISKALETYAGTISKTAGFMVEAGIYEGVGLNGFKSIYCDFAGQNVPFRLNLEIITGPRQELDLFIIDFNIPEELRGQGMGSRIICGLLGIFSKFRIKTVTLNPVGKRAQKFWQKFGFSQISGQRSLALNMEDKEYTISCACLLFRSLKDLTA